MLPEKPLCVMLVISKLAGWAGKLYVYPGLPKIAKLSKRWFGVSISQRTCVRAISYLLTENYIGRQPRPTPCPGGLWKSQTSLTFLTWKSLNLLYRLRGLGELASVLTERSKKASNIFQTRRSSSVCGKLGNLISQFFPKGGPSGTYSTPLKISP